MKPRPLATYFLSTYEFAYSYDSWAKSNLRGYSRRAFAKWAKVSSPNFVSLVLSKKRTLKGEWLNGFIKAAKLAAEEETHLRKLNAFEEERSPEKRMQLLIEIRKTLSNSNIKSLAHDQLVLLTQPLAWVLYYMMDLKGQKNEPIWFKQRLRLLKVTAVEISEALQTLKRLGLVELKNEKLVTKEKLITSPDQIQKSTNAIFHENILDEAKLALRDLLPQDRSFGSLTATVESSKIQSLKNEVQEFGQYLLTKYASHEDVDGEVFRLNIQLYPLTEKAGS